MKASLIRSEDEHHWVLLEHRVVQVSVDPASVRIQSWGVDGSVEVRLAAPFALVLPSGVRREMDPHVSESLAPLLSLVRRPLRALTIGRRGELACDFGDGATLTATSGTRREGWEVQGGGVLEGMSYRSDALGEMWGEE
ncbi:MAG TPA: DUF6188 family protein [Gemmatimonadaceae bacterium]|nr:DUF6188 family protein [Gemmatimonadaceae bacterium]